MKIFGFELKVENITPEIAGATLGIATGATLGIAIGGYFFGAPKFTNLIPLNKALAGRIALATAAGSTLALASFVAFRQFQSQNAPRNPIDETPAPQRAPEPVPAPREQAPGQFRDAGIGTPTWSVTLNGQEEVYALDQLPPFRFAQDPDFIVTDQGLKESNGLFHLSKGSRLLYDGTERNPATGQLEDFTYSEYSAIKFTCPTLTKLLRDRGISDGIAENTLHCAESSPVNLNDMLKEDFHWHPNTASYRFIYPAQLHPVHAGQVINALQADNTVPAYLKGLILIGGYAYYDQHDRLVGVNTIYQK